MHFRTTILYPFTALLIYLSPATGCATSPVDNTSLHHKLIVGYQGWFLCSGDGNPKKEWKHWFTENKADIAHVHFDFLPDTSELDKDELCLTGLQRADGTRINLYSAQNPKTVDRHFLWMQHYGIDGAALQRFVRPLRSPQQKQAMDKVLDNVRYGAEKHGRVFYIMYDLSGATVEDMNILVSDWQNLESRQLTESHSYLRHRGRPVLCLWGLGFAGRPIPPGNILTLITTLRDISKPYGGVTIIGGVPAYWRTANRDADTDPQWQSVYQSLDILSPWTVGRYQDIKGAASYTEKTIISDLGQVRQRGQEYLPVIFPGFSWSNLMRTKGQEQKATLNQIPRAGGRFLWSQAEGDVAAGADMLYIAMFDEVDEGTAIFKLEPNTGNLPIAPAMVALDADGQRLPNDWYLQVSGKIAELLKGNRNPKLY